MLCSDDEKAVQTSKKEHCAEELWSLHKTFESAGISPIPKWKAIRHYYVTSKKKRRLERVMKRRLRMLLGWRLLSMKLRVK